jgi:hypothetical protein
VRPMGEVVFKIDVFVDEFVADVVFKIGFVEQQLRIDRGEGVRGSEVLGKRIVVHGSISLIGLPRSQIGVGQPTIRRADHISSTDESGSILHP